MTRKSTMITLAILGVVAAVGSCACCLHWDDAERQNAQGGHGGGGHVHHRSRGFWPIFLGGGGSHWGGGGGSRVGAGTSSGTSRGGFGSTSGHGGSSGGHGSASS